jgi:hypothetical protein
MRFTIIKTVTILFFALSLFSCHSTPINGQNSQSWRVPEKSKSKGTIKLVSVSADRGGGRNSLEQEIAVLAPLCFWGERYKTVGSRDHADYAVAISLREREFAVGWRTKRSLAVEVRIWRCVDGDILPEELERLPVSAGRIISTGNVGFSSSKVTGRMLSRAVTAAVKQLSVVQRGYSLSQKER